MLNNISFVSPTGFRTFHFVSFLYGFFFSFRFLLFRFFSHCFLFVFLHFVFFAFLFVTFLTVFFRFFFCSFLFVFSVFLHFSVYRYPTAPRAWGHCITTPTTDKIWIHPLNNNPTSTFKGRRFYLCTQVPCVAVKKWN